MPRRRHRFFSWLHRRPLYQKLAMALGLALVPVVVIAATVGVSSEVADFMIRGPRSEPPAEKRQELERRFAPILKLDSKELFVPIDIASYVSATALGERRGKRLMLIGGTPMAATLPDSDSACSGGLSCTFVLDVRGAEPPGAGAKQYRRIQDQLLADGTRVTVYAHVTRYLLTGDYAVQYWFLYLFNHRLNEHESDWEQITIGLDSDEQPKKVLYSSHSTGFVREWDDVERDGDHPVVYVALGSHANYFHAGSHDVTISCPKILKRRRICIRNRDIRDRSNGRGMTLAPVDYRLAEFAPPIFVGSFGTGNYVLGIRSNEILSDPRTRSAFADPLARLVRGMTL